MDRYLVIRADVSTQIGTGHLMRCLALAQAWQAQGGQAAFIMACESDSLRQRLAGEGFQVITLEGAHLDPADWKVTSQALRAHPGAWVVLDGYHFDPAYQRQVKEAGHRLLVIDDMAHLEHYYADIVLNQNIHAEQLRYSCEPYTRLLLGTRYVLLRSEFLAWRGWQRKIPQVARKVLVTLGGSDPDNQTLKVIRALQQVDVDGLEAVVVVGANNPYLGKLQAAVGPSGGAIHLAVDVADISSLMAWADIAVSAAGSTCWELAFMSLPSLLLVLADNQRPVAGGLDAAEAAVSLGWHEDVAADAIVAGVMQLAGSPDKRARLATRSRELVDGAGATRVARVMQEAAITLRPVRPEDARLIWMWANDPETRIVSFSSEPISWEQHEAWFIAKLADPQCLFYVALDIAGEPIGQIRYQIEEDEAVLSVSVVPGKRGRGYGTSMIRLASRQVFTSASVKVIHAYIKPENVASIQAFASAGFINRGAVEVHGHHAFNFALVREAQL